MSEPKLFISHSTNGLPQDDRSVEIRERLYTILSEKGWDVFVDRYSIHPGDEWRMEVLHNLAEAQSGIILFNDRAVSESAWVASEALILCFRKSIDPDFQVVPVLLDGKNLNDTCFEKYEPFQLNEIQAIKDDQSLSLDKFAEVIAAKLDPSKARIPPMSRWVQQVVGYLQMVTISDLKRAAKRLRISTEGDLWNKLGEQRQECLCRTVVELMHHRPPLECVEAFSEIVGQLSDRNANKFRSRLVAKWVANQAVEVILCASRKPEELGLLTVNTKRQEIVDEYLNRAKIEIPDHDGTKWVFPVSGGAGEGDDAIIKQIENAIREEIVDVENGNFPDDNNEDMSLPQAVEKLLDLPGDVAICALPYEYAKDGIIERMRQQYPKIILLIPVGNPPKNLSCFDTMEWKPLLPLLDANKLRELASLKSRLRTTIENC